LGTGLIAVNANAGVVFDLRFSGAQPVGSGGAGDGLHSLGAVPGTYHLDLWARVSGTNGTTTDEALTNVYTSIASLQTNGGAVTAGSLANAQTTSTFTSSGISGNGGPANLSSDGIGDWGGTSSNLNDTNYLFSRSPNASSGGELGGVVNANSQSVDANTWEFKIATYDIVVSAVGGTGVTGFNVVKPNATFKGTTITAATYLVSKVDNTTLNITSANVGGTYTGSTGVSLVPVPEPTALGLLGVGAVGLISRKRRK